MERIPGGARQKDGVETGIMGAAAARLAWLAWGHRRTGVAGLVIAKVVSVGLCQRRVDGHARRDGRRACSRAERPPRTKSPAVVTAKDSASLRHPLCYE